MRKPSIIITKLAIILFFILLVGYSAYESRYIPKRPQPSPSTTYAGIGLKARGPGEPKWSMSHKKFTSLNAARGYMRDDIMLPSFTAGRYLKIIWIEKTKAQYKRTAIGMYEKGLQVIAYPSDYKQGQGLLGNLAQHEDSVKLTVHEMLAYGAEPSEIGPRGNPGQVIWWEKGITYTVAGDGLSLKLLRKVAESTRLPEM